MFGLPVSTLIKIGAVLGIVAGIGLFIGWVYKQGAESERVDTIERSQSRTADRNKTDEQLRKATQDALCREFGARRWVPDEQRCE